MTVRVQFIGTGDAFGSGGRFQTCFLVEDSRGLFTVDLGPSSLVAMKRMDIDPADLDMVLISHLHGDHFGGLPFLLLDRQLRARRAAPLTLAGPVGLKRQLERLCDAMFPGIWKTKWVFPLHIQELVPGEETEISGRRIHSREVVHATGDTVATALRVRCDDRVIAYSGDTGWTDVLYEVADGSDLFVCECYFFEANANKFHINLADVLAKRDRLNTRRLVLTHMGEETLKRIAEFDVETAEDGKTVVL